MTGSTEGSPFSTPTGNADACFALGEARRLEGDDAGAIAAYRLALAADKSFIAAHNNAALLLARAGRMDEAAAHYEAALRLDDSIPAVHYNCAMALDACGRTGDAIEAYSRAVALAPDFANAQLNLGTLLHACGDLDAAEDHLRQAARLAPQLALPHANLGTVLKDQGYTGEALAACVEAIRRDPDCLLGWSNLFVNASYLADEIAPDQLAAWFRQYDTGRAIANSAPPPARPASRGRVRLGYVSADFRDHAVSYFFEPVLAAHDRARFDIFCYDCGSIADAVTERLRATETTWRACAAASDDELARLIQQDGIDILIDLMGHTAGNRLPVFARRPAPLQGTWLGWPASTGLAAIDFAIVDRYIAEAPLDPRLYAERPLALPHTWLCYRPDAAAPPVSDIVASPITFGSFNGVYKLGTRVLDTWCRLLQAVPESRLLIVGVPPGRGGARLREAFAARGIAGDRIELAAPCPIEAFYGHLSRVHVALDPFPFSASTTTLHTLWMGVPVVTLAGTTHAGRMGCSIMRNAGLARLIAHNDEEYVALAASLAADTEALRAFRGSLRDTLRGSPLMDVTGFTRALEAAYVRAREVRP
jgi:predicted O-linked N-acetylglucosamine transferase (SPINDLY family)